MQQKEKPAKFGGDSGTSGGSSDLSGLKSLAEKAKAKADAATKAKDDEDTRLALEMEKRRKTRAEYCTCGNPKTICDIGPFHWRETS